MQSCHQTPIFPYRGRARQTTQEEEFQAKLQEQEWRFEELQKQLEGEQSSHKREQEKFGQKFQEQEKRFEKLEQNFREMVGKLEDVKIREQKTLFEDFKAGAKTELEELKRRCGVWKFTMNNFSKEKAKDKWSDWKSPPMYTHPGGYKFCIGIDANGYEDSCGKSVNVDLWVMKGEYDDQLQWPVTAKFTLELINHFENGGTKTCTITPSWGRPTEECEWKKEFLTVPGRRHHFISHSELPHNSVTSTHFLKDDTLNFHLSEW